MGPLRHVSTIFEMDDEGNFKVRESSASASDSVTSNFSPSKIANSVSSTSSHTLAEDTEEQSPQDTVVNFPLPMRKERQTEEQKPISVRPQQGRRLICKRSYLVIDLDGEDDDHRVHLIDNEPPPKKTCVQQLEIDEALARKLEREYSSPEAMGEDKRQHDEERPAKNNTCNYQRDVEEKPDQEKSDMDQQGVEDRSYQKESLNNQEDIDELIAWRLHRELNSPEALEHQLRGDGRNVIRSSQNQRRGNKPHCSNPQPNPRNPPFPQKSWIEKAKVDWGHSIIQADTTFELGNGDFIQIKVFKQNLETMEVRVRGLLLRRCTSMKGHIEKKLNELCYIVDMHRDDPRPELEQALIEVGMDDLLQQRTLVRTNIHRQDGLHRGESRRGESKAQTHERLRETARLIVRWKYIRIWNDTGDRLKNRRLHCEYRIERLKKKDCDEGQGLSADTLRCQWRGKTALGGSGTRTKASMSKERAQDNPSSNARQRNDGNHECSKCKERFQSFGEFRRHREEKQCVEILHARVEAAHIGDGRPESTTQAYTYGDTYSGGGGSTSGGVQAGLDLQYAMDAETDCCSTLRANFPGVRIFQEYSNVFATRREDLQVDILHMSPPCQPWSAAHPGHGRGKNDDKNIASLFSFIPFIEKVKPRLVTVEQTGGILTQWEDILITVVHAFTSQDYSVTWRILRFQEFGLPQVRKRLIMIAAGPGETLPEFPPMTHSHTGGGQSNLKPFFTPGDALSEVPPIAPNHDLVKARDDARGKQHLAWDASKLLACMTTKGGERSWHPWEHRYLTLRERARFQLFPDDHVFCGGAMSIKRQIGNAVPPGVFKILFLHVVERLEEADDVEKAEIAARVIDLTAD